MSCVHKPGLGLVLRNNRASRYIASSRFRRELSRDARREYAGDVLFTIGALLLFALLLAVSPKGPL